MTDIFFKDVCLTPEDHYETPADVVEDPRWSKDQKRKILEAWKLNEHALIRSGAEGMERPENSEASVRLILVAKAEERLESA